MIRLPPTRAGESLHPAEIEGDSVGFPSRWVGAYLTHIHKKTPASTHGVAGSQKNRYRSYEGVVVTARFLDRPLRASFEILGVTYVRIVSRLSRVFFRNRQRAVGPS